ncbi:MAG: prolyl oligopeptidase family serine peptidase [Bacteroidetes bacterium]|uniref:alpha/beta hydrolase family protein n=1 Tax=Phnomibacter sp. TaxID=2836217 RepID=UPI002FDD3345|nr:prolyl oligopeptidase family serine peptidase [Bacteroidota bacterium]
MRKYACMLLAMSLAAGQLSAQKKPLDHSVYDGWESIQERVLSNNGEYTAFTVNPQEGDGRLVLANKANSWRLEVPRGYMVSLSADSRYAVFKIKPTYQETRDARIKKKRPDDMPKDSLGIVQLGSSNVLKIARVKAYKMPSDAGGWMAYHMDKPLPDTAKKAPVVPKNPQADSLRKVVDSLTALLQKFPEKVQQKYLKDAEGLGLNAEGLDADEPAGAAAGGGDAGTELVWYELATGKKLTWKNALDFTTDKMGNKLVIKTAKVGKGNAYVLSVDVAAAKVDTVMTAFNDVKNLTLDEEGLQLAFVAERDSSAKAIQKFYKLWYWRHGTDSAMLIADRTTAGKTNGWTVSEFANLSFSKSGERLMFGVAPVMPPKDTTVPEFEKAQLDIWHYKDDYLQPYQLRNLTRELNRSYLTVYHVGLKKVVQLADQQLQDVRPSGNGDGKWFWAVDDKASRIASQWAGRGKGDMYVIDPVTGSKQLVKAGVDGMPMGTSMDGTTLLWYENGDKQYHTWKDGKEFVPSKGIKVALYDEDNDVPDDPSPYGALSWEKDGSALYVYDKYDIWKLDPMAAKAPEMITGGIGRSYKWTIRWQNLNREENFVESGKPYLFTIFNNTDKTAAIKWQAIGKPFVLNKMAQQTLPTRLASFVKAKDADVLSFSTENYQQTPDIRVATLADAVSQPMQAVVLCQPNPQQSQYLWGTAELIEWKAYDGKMTQGIVYKPENFDPKKKYPMIAYFYETLSDGLYSYTAPAPTPSRLNIPFFVSRGYVVLAPDIHYRKGEPGQSAYDYIVSGARHLVKLGYVDSTKMGLQGQSWGGYQTVQLITMTKLFAAAWAGAPVANMTSAYGGIRWESGLNRQFQYEKTQSRIGATLWERQDLYLKNSPLFHLPKNKTPLVVMHNDADGAVPWYQGIELFTAMRRLGQPVWLLQYNNEAHNLVERRNRKDIQIREQQFFDWFLKGEKPAKWLTEGVPATMKGRDYGLE